MSNQKKKRFCCQCGKQETPKKPGIAQDFFFPDSYNGKEKFKPYIFPLETLRGAS